MLISFLPKNKIATDMLWALHLVARLLMGMLAIVVMAVWCVN